MSISINMFYHEEKDKYCLALWNTGTESSIETQLSFTAWLSQVELNDLRSSIDLAQKNATEYRNNVIMDRIWKDIDNGSN